MSVNNGLGDTVPNIEFEKQNKKKANNNTQQNPEYFL